MGLFDRFFKKDLNKTVFSFINGSAAPDMKGPDFLKAYKGWVYACVNAISEEVATIGLRLQQFRNGRWVDLDNHIALQLLRQVNSFMSSSDLVLATQAYLELEGNAFWYLPRGSITAKPAEIWVLDPTRVLIVKSQKEFIGGYVYRNEVGQNVPLTPQEILHFKRFNPLNRYRGIGTVAAAALAIDIDTFSAQWNKNFFYNAAVPSAVLEAEGTLSEEQYNKIQAKWDSRYTGMDNAHKLIILQGGMKFKPAQLSQKDMDFLEQRKFTRDEILGIFRVPKTILGITEDVNRANAEASEFVFAKRVVKPKMEFIVDRLNEFYLPLFGLNQSQFRFVFDDPVPQNVELRLKANETALRAGYKTINEVREDEGLDPIQNGDEVLIPLSLIPLGGVSNPANPETPPAKQVHKEFDAKTLEMVEKRVRFVISEIKKREARFKRIFIEAGERLFNKLRLLDNKSIKKDKKSDLTREALEELGPIEKLVGDEIKGTISTSFEEAGKTAIIQAGSEAVFDLNNDRAASAILDAGLEDSKQVVGTLRDQVKERIAEGVDAGDSVDEIADSLKGFFNANADAKANVIARTEVIKGYAQGSLEGYKQSGNVTAKSWDALPDADDECLANVDDGEIPIDTSFSSGDSAPPVHPNCRCVLIPITGDITQSLTYQKIISKVDEHVSNELKRFQVLMEKNERELAEERGRIITDAKNTSSEIIEIAKKQAQQEKSSILGELKKLKDRALELVYEEKE